MTNDELKAKLGEQLYGELVKRTAQIATKHREEGRAEGLAQGRREGDGGVVPWVKGFVRSWTTRLGAALVAAPAIAEELAPHVLELMAQNSSLGAQALGVVMILLRFKTTKSLKERAHA